VDQEDQGDHDPPWWIRTGFSILLMYFYRLRYRYTKFTSPFLMQFLAYMKIDTKLATAYYHLSNGHTEGRIITIHQYLRNFINPKGTKWTRHLSHNQTTLHAAPDDSSEL